MCVTGIRGDGVVEHTPKQDLQSGILHGRHFAVGVRRASEAKEVTMERRHDFPLLRSPLSLSEPNEPRV